MADRSLSQLLNHWHRQAPDRPALLAPGRKPLTYGALLAHAAAVGKTLRSIGIQPNDRVAIVLPNGPEMAAAFLSVAATATAAPLNPYYRTPEYEFYLSDLGAKALIIQHDYPSPARKAARQLDIPVIELHPTLDQPAGIFELDRPQPPADLTFDFAQPNEIALVLHTSGTTSRPKIVPLTHLNICASANHIRATLQLTPDDRCLNVMPLFHIHGLMGATLSSIAAGASVVCTPGFAADRFFAWLAEFGPTWYSAVPTMHQAVLASVQDNREPVEGSRLRLIRSSSASLPPAVMTALEKAFGAPVIESYGMTEAAHQMTSNLLPPGQRKPGTVGVAAGPEVAIMDDNGNFLPADSAGEIVIRGPNVTAGYENNPQANAGAFTDGWFRTGDQGVMDGDGFLTIVGRLKEIINRGGENIAPREIDELLLTHPEVVQATAFAVPHPTLGEDVAAAVILRDGADTTPAALRQFAFAHLAEFKVPSQIIVVDDIPKGPTGKLQRIGLADKLTEALQSDYAPPMGPLQHELIRIWTNRLQIERIGVNDNFFALGGDSIVGAQVAAEIGQLTDQNIPPSLLFQAPTIAEMARRLDENIAVPVRPEVVSVNATGQRRPLFGIPSHEGDPFTFLALSRYLGNEQPVYTFRFSPREPLEHLAITPAIVELAADTISEMRTVQPEGPYALIGFCFGGVVAYEIARQLLDQGDEVDLLVVVDAYLAGSIRSAGRERLTHHLKRMIDLPLAEKVGYVVEITRRLVGLRDQIPAPQNQLKNGTVVGSDRSSWRFPGRLTLMRPTEEESDLVHDPQMGWGGTATEIELFDISCQRNTVFEEPAVRELAQKVARCLLRVEKSG